MLFLLSVAAQHIQTDRPNELKAQTHRPQHLQSKGFSFERKGGKLFSSVNCPSLGFLKMPN